MIKEAKEALRELLKEKENCDFKLIELHQEISSQEGYMEAINLAIEKLEWIINGEQEQE